MNVVFENKFKKFLPHPVEFRDLDPDIEKSRFIFEVAVAEFAGFAKIHPTVLRRADALAETIKQQFLSGDINGLIFDDPEDAKALYREFFIARYFRDSYGVIIETTGALDVLMQNTDIDQLPAKLLNPPFENIYINFGKPIAIEDGKSSVHGIYLLTKTTPVDLNKKEDIDFFKVATNSRPNGDTEVKSYEMIFSLFEEDSETPNALSFASMHVGNQSSEGLVAKIKDVLKQFFNDSLSDLYEATIESAFKTIAYMGIKDYRSVDIKEHTDFKKKLMGLGLKKLAKLSNKERYKFDRILVGPEKLDQSPASYSESDRHVTPHWRRGHFRTQRFGEELSESKIIWIKPLIVNATDDIDPKPKVYRVKP